MNSKLVNFLVTSMTIFCGFTASAQSEVEVGAGSTLKITSTIMFKDSIKTPPGDRVAVYFQNGAPVTQAAAEASKQPYCRMEAYAKLNRVPPEGVPLHSRTLNATLLDDNREWIKLEPSELPLYLTCTENSSLNVKADLIKKSFGHYLEMDLVPAPPPAPYQKIEFEKFRNMDEGAPVSS